MLNVTSPRVDAFSEADKQLLQLYANQAAVALENSKLFEETRQRVSQLESIRTIDEAISGSFDLNLVLEIVLAQITIQLGVDSAAIVLLNPATQTLRFAAGRGFQTNALKHTNLRYGSGYAGQAALERRNILIPDLDESIGDFRNAPLLPRENFVSYIAVPLIAKGQVRRAGNFPAQPARSGSGLAQIPEYPGHPDRDCDRQCQPVQRFTAFQHGTGAGV